MPVTELYLLLFRGEQIVFWRQNTNNKFQPMGCHMFQNNKCDFESRSLSCGQLKIANSEKNCTKIFQHLHVFTSLVLYRIRKQLCLQNSTCQFHLTV